MQLDSGKNVLALRAERPREKGFPSFSCPAVTKRELDDRP